MKVVQLLYSYLLVQNNFSVQSAPASPTKEKRFAYSLYLDYLYLMMEIARSITSSAKGSPLYDTRFIQRLLSDNIFKSLIHKYSAGGFPLAPAVASLAENIKASSIYKNFLKDQQNDSTIWPQLFKQFISRDTQAVRLIEGFDNYSSRGVERAQDMITETFAEFAASQDNIADGLADLAASLDKAREYYMRLLLLPIDITFLQEQELDERRHRYIIKEEDKNPNPKFIDNELVKLMKDSPTLNEYAEAKKISWLEQDRDLVSHLLKKIIGSELYAEYMSEDSTDLKQDTAFWRKVMTQIILHDEEFLENLETKSVFWNDDFEIMNEFALKTFRRFEEKASVAGAKIDDPVFPMYKDTEDSRFGRLLFEATAKNYAKYSGYIDDALNTQHWESDRLAFMDVIVMVTALAEIFSFPKIPIQASLNEYIEIAKSYSSGKSGSFVNGLLGSVITNLKESGKLRK